MDGHSQKQMGLTASCAQALARLGRSPVRASLALLGLCLAVYLPGVIRLPAVDRTEVIYAETTRDMVARGQWLDPKYGDTAHQFRPIGPYWAQGAAARIAGESHARDITVYRLPGLIAVTLAVLALFWLSAPIVGQSAALMASGLFAVAPLTVLLAQLAIGESLSLLPAVVAMLALLRIYTREDEHAEAWLKALFWIAIGFGMLLNALQTPILIAATLIALFVMDRDLGWLKRTRPLFGLTLALAIASPWLIVRTHQDGVPFTGMSWGDVIDALSGSQDMKLKAWPGTFLLAVILGFLPGTALIGPAIKQLWDTRTDRLPRFLFAWVIGYVIYLELLSSKPGTYSVQLIFPALAIAVARWITSDSAKSALPKWHLMPWPPLAAIFAVALLAAPYLAASQIPSLAALILVAAVACLFFVSAREGKALHFTSWAPTGIAALGLFAVTLLAVILPSIDKAWPSRQIARALSTCPNSKVALLGYREPTSAFILSADRGLQTPEAAAAKKPAVAIVEARWLDRYREAYTKSNQSLPPVRGCIYAFNVTRGCKLDFTIFAADTAGCQIPQEFVCKDTKIYNAAATAPKSRNCD